MEEEVSSFCILWFIKMSEQFIKDSNENGLAVLVHSLYEVLNIDEPVSLAAITENGQLAQYVVELMEDLTEIAEEEL